MFVAKPEAAYSSGIRRATASCISAAAAAVDEYLQFHPEDSVGEICDEATGARPGEYFSQLALAGTSAADARQPLPRLPSSAKSMSPPSPEQPIKVVTGD